MPEQYKSSEFCKIPSTVSNFTRWRLILLEKVYINRKIGFLKIRKKSLQKILDYIFENIKIHADELIRRDIETIPENLSISNLLIDDTL